MLWAVISSAWHRIWHLENVTSSAIAFACQCVWSVWSNTCQCEVTVRPHWPLFSLTKPHWHSLTLDMDTMGPRGSKYVHHFSSWHMCQCGLTDTHSKQRLTWPRVLFHNERADATVFPLQDNCTFRIAWHASIELRWQLDWTIQHSSQCGALQPPPWSVQWFCCSSQLRLRASELNEWLCLTTAATMQATSYPHPAIAGTIAEVHAFRWRNARTVNRVRFFFELNLFIENKQKPYKKY